MVKMMGRAIALVVVKFRVCSAPSETRPSPWRKLRQQRNSGICSLVGIKFELDFHCRAQQSGCETTDNPVMMKSGIGGKKYLDYL
jgi:hypothetical protein